MTPGLIPPAVHAAIQQGRTRGDGLVTLPLLEAELLLEVLDAYHWWELAPHTEASEADRRLQDAKWQLREVAR